MTKLADVKAAIARKKSDAPPLCPPTVPKPIIPPVGGSGTAQPKIPKPGSEAKSATPPKAKKPKKKRFEVPGRLPHGSQYVKVYDAQKQQWHAELMVPNFLEPFWGEASSSLKAEYAADAAYREHQIKVGAVVAVETLKPGQRFKNKYGEIVPAGDWKTLGFQAGSLVEPISDAEAEEIDRRAREQNPATPPL